jgi:raffinose/stachyose/melibiose transport system permease protein
VKKSDKSFFRTATTVLVAFLFSLPIFIIIVSSFKTSEEILKHPASLPSHMTLGNFSHVLHQGDLLPGLERSFFITAISALVTCALSAQLAYVLARSKSRNVKLFRGVLLAGFMVPGQVLLVPIVDVLRRVHILGTYLGLVLANVGFFLPFAVFVFMRFIRGISSEIDEAAAIDGASKSRTFWVVIFPLLKPATASVLIFLTVWIWNDFLSPLIILGPLGGNTVITGLYYQVSSRQVSDYGSIFAYMLLASAPILVLFLFLQKQFISGLTAGATKG